MKSKENKVVKSLKLLFIGNLLILLGLFGALDFITPFIAFIALLSVVGIFILLFGVVRLARINVFFFISFITVLVSMVIGIGGSLINVYLFGTDFANFFDILTQIIAKLSSMVFMFGIIRGCSKAALGKARTPFAFKISLINFIGKTIVIVFLLLEGFLKKSNPTAANVFSVIQMVISIIVQVCFLVYLYLAYRYAKAHLNKFEK